jgi:CDP-diacylglycerol--glycerol-3-phosphate 3-phosphatidyltransferase
MSVSTQQPKPASTMAGEEIRRVAFNLPNQLTYLRLGLTIVLFWLIAYEHYLSAMLLFVVAASTDWLDGYFARKYNQVTTLGRILDPFADKVIICGTFIFLVAIPDFDYLRPWMAVVVVGRELLVTALRSFIEERGTVFRTSLAGKLKMVLQCAAATASLYYLYRHSHATPPADAPAWLDWTLLVSIWSAMVVTIYSGLGYVVTVARLLRGA